jgi:hypothetical protein
LSEAYGTYSDWYKDLNGVRPRCYWYGNFDE